MKKFKVNIKDKSTGIETILYDGVNEHFAKMKYKLHCRLEKKHTERIVGIEEYEQKAR